MARPFSWVAVTLEGVTVAALWLYPNASAASSGCGSGARVSGSSAGIATKYLYRPSKTVEMYVGCGYSQWDRLDAGAVKTDKSVNAYSGVTKYF